MSRRLTRASARASETSPEATPSVTNTLPSKRSTPAVFSRTSTAYGSPGTPVLAQRMSVQKVLEQSKESRSVDDDSELDSTYGTGPRNAQPPDVDEPSALMSAMDYFEDITLWAPRRMGLAAPSPKAPEVDAEDFWDKWDQLDRARLVRNENRRQTLHYILLFIKLVAWSLVGFTLYELYFGPVRPNSPLFKLPAPNMNAWTARVHNLEARLKHLPTSTILSAAAIPTIVEVPQINWFAMGNDAVIDPYLSSPSLVNCPHSDSWFRKAACIPASRPHSQILQPWTEPGERWCAAPSQGRLQVTIHTRQPVMPTQLVIEHLPREAAIHPGAPRDIELWLDMGIQRAPLVKDGQALPSSFLRIGQWTYNESGPSVQTFDIESAEARGERFAVRVLSNWGDSNSSCLYRIRLHGH